MKHIKTFESFNTNTLNEGKLLRNVIKTYFNIITLIKKLPSLFFNEKRKNILSELKLGNKIIDILVFLNDNKEIIHSALDGDKLLKTLEDKYDTDNIGEIIEKMYKEDLKRSLKTDVKNIVDYFESDEFKIDIKKSKPMTIKKTYDIIDVFKELDKMIK